jgi:uncharacterized protein YkwD
MLRLFTMTRIIPQLGLLFFALIPVPTLCPVHATPNSLHLAAVADTRSSKRARDAGIRASSMESDILIYVNEDRKQHGLAALRLNDVESDIAAKHSRDMASGKVPFGHSGFNERAKAIGKALGSIRTVGENVASGPMNARQVVDGWLNSPGHKRNIEGDFTLTGIGYAPDKKGNIFFTQIFSK